MEEVGKGELPVWHKAAVLLLTLGDDLASELMRGLSDEELEQMTRALSELKKVPTSMRDEALVEFEAALVAEAPARGGIDVARRLLEKALGAERAEEMLARVADEPTNGFALLRAADPAQVAPFIAQEHPQTIALILSQLEAAQAAALLGYFSRDCQVEVAHRIATLGQVAPEVLQEVEESLAQILAGALGRRREVGGSQMVADILNAAGSRLEKGVLDRIDHADPEVAEEIRKGLMLFDDLARLSDQDVLTVMRHIDMGDLLQGLKSAGKGVRDLFLRSMSERRRQRFFEDMEALPPLRLSEVEEAQDRIVQQVRLLEEQQILRVPRGGGEDDPYV